MTLIILLIFGIVCAMIAHSKGRNAIGWFLIGCLLGLIGFIVILCMSNLNEERQRQARQDEENRRLREKLRQEQLKLESLRRHTAERLDHHDRALQMDTRSTVPQMLGAGSSFGPGPALAEQTPPPMPIEIDLTENAGPEPRIWHFVSRQQQCGPVTLRQLATLVSSGQVTRDTLVWQEALPDWTEAGRLPEFSELFV